MSEREFLSRAPLGDTLEYQLSFFYVHPNITLNLIQIHQFSFILTRPNIFYFQTACLKRAQEEKRQLRLKYPCLRY